MLKKRESRVSFGFKGFIIFMLLILGLTNIIHVSAGTLLGKEKTAQYLEEISTYQISVNGNPSYGTSGGEWTIFALARCGMIKDSYKQTYIKNLKSEIEKCKGILSTRKYTEYARVVIALTSIGENPENFSGYNLVQPLAEYDKVKLQGLTGIAYTLIALDCGNYKLADPEDENSSDYTTKSKLIEALLRSELENGGWSYGKKTADSDITAIVIQALIPYMNNNEKVKKAIDNGFESLSKIQNSSGSFTTNDIETCESTAQVLTAMSEAGVSISDKRFVKNGNTVLDSLFRYYNSGAFSHTEGGKNNSMATDQAMYALTAYYRGIVNANNLYDMSDGINVDLIKQNLALNSKEPDTKKDNSDETKVSSNNKKKRGSSSNKKSKNSQQKKVKQEVSSNYIENTSKKKEEEAQIKSNRKNSKKENDMVGEDNISRTILQEEKKTSEDRTSKTNLIKKEAKRYKITGIVIFITVIVIGTVTGSIYVIKKKRTSK